MAQGFQHTPLTLHRGIRVLDLLPSRKRNAPLECKTREIALGDPHEPYKAISYVWGERVGTCPISCNGQEMLVTPNCRDALLQLRSSYRTRTLWIDAICIDQSDTGTLERNEQIKAANYAFFFLDNGYMGMAYHTYQEGDQVYLLAGSDWPFILRPKGDAFRIVAPASIHGVMEGELWPEDESELDQITLV
ncbi:hypothetical protein MGN70_013383 [Eutypa lata]|nr:hypothetical protein MGN70_013383 [Eutypa lata]